MITATPMWRASKTAAQLGVVHAHLDLVEMERTVKVTISNVCQYNSTSSQDF